MILPVYARLLGLLIGARVDVHVKSAANAPFAPWGFGQLDSVSLTAVPSGETARTPLPMQAASVSGECLVLGWKAPALLLAPVWLFVRPSLAPLLLLAWLRLPNSGEGTLEWEGMVSASSLSRGVWRAMLGLVLDSVARSSLPAVLATARTDADGRVSTAKLPRSVCTSVSVSQGRGAQAGKLELEGVMAAASETPRAVGGAAGAAPLSSSLGNQLGTQLGSLEYTVRVGLT
jgi:hypothetical protein